MTPRILRDIAVPATGCRLATDVYLPPAPASGPASPPRPAVLVRTPYGRTAHAPEAVAWAVRGHTAVVQDVRGRHGSTGRWHPWRGEVDDAAATIAWLAAQPWSDGRVVTRGASYAAHTAWACALAAPEAVLGVASTVAALGPRQVKLDPSGVLRLAEHVTWWVEHGDSDVSRPGLPAALLRADPGLLDTLPVIAVAQRLGSPMPGFTDMLCEVVDPAGRGDDIHAGTLAGLDVPSLHVGGWYDLLVADTVSHTAAVGRDVTPRPPRTLVVGPWGHEVDTSARLPLHPSPLGAHEVAWIERCLAGRGRERHDEFAVWDLGSRTWTRGRAWPADARPAIATPCWWGETDGRLLPSAPPAAGGTEVLHDPDRPVPHTPIGGDREALTDRHDVLRLTTPALPGPVSARGPAVADIALRSPAATADLVVRLLHLSGGRTTVVSRGMAVAGGDLTAGTVVPVPMSPVNVTAAAGDRLALEIAFSDHPHVARDLGTGDDRYRTRRTAAVRHTVLTGRNGTRVRLPTADVAPREESVP